MRYDAIEDGCQYRTNTWSKTSITYTTEKATRLPIVDISIRDVGEPNQAFWVEVGPVCFY